MKSSTTTQSVIPDTSKKNKDQAPLKSASKRFAQGYFKPLNKTISTEPTADEMKDEEKPMNIQLYQPAPLPLCFNLFSFPRFDLTVNTAYNILLGSPVPPPLSKKSMAEADKNHICSFTFTCGK